MDGKSANQPTWRTAIRCDGGQCVEIGILDKSVLARSSAQPNGMTLTLSRDEWHVFVTRVKDGDFDGP